MSGLVRRGAVVHRDDCPCTHEFPPVPWQVPAGEDPRRYAAEGFLLLCTTCQPLGPSRIGHKRGESR